MRAGRVLGCRQSGGGPTVWLGRQQSAICLLLAFQPSPSLCCAPRTALPAATRRQCVELFTSTYGDLLQEEAVVWQRRGAASGRLLDRPVCWLPFLGCVYL